MSFISVTKDVTSWVYSTAKEPLFSHNIKNLLGTSLKTHPGHTATAGCSLCVPPSHHCLPVTAGVVPVLDQHQHCCLSSRGGSYWSHLFVSSQQGTHLLRSSPLCSTWAEKAHGSDMGGLCY